MHIKFGWNDFNIKTFSLEELYIPNPSKEDIKIEVRQRYFHIFFIPVFGLGKKWILHKNKQQFELPEDLKELVKKTQSVKTPFYTYTLLIIVLSGFLAYVSYDSYKEYKYKKADKQEYESILMSIDSKLKTPLTSNDYIVLSREGNIFKFDGYYLKIKSINGELITAYKYPRDYKNNTIYEAMENNTDPDTVLLNIENIKAAIYRDFKNEEELFAFGKDLFNNDTLYRVSGIQNIYDADLKLESNFCGFHIYEDDACKNGCASFEISNWGAPVTLIAVKNLDSSLVDFSRSLPLRIESTYYGTKYSTGNTRIQGTNFSYQSGFKTLFIFEDSLKRQQKYIIENKTRKDYQLSMKKVL